MAESLAGRTFLITGANTGIGRVTACELARAGAHVIVACRSEEKTLPVIEEIRRDTGNANVEFLKLDLSNLDSVREAASSVASRDKPLDCLINNAGVAGARGRTKQGFEVTFGVNHLGHFLLTTLLLDRLKQSSAARIINVSSKAHYRPRTIDWDALRKPTRSRTGFHEYAISKFCNVLFTQELARKLAGTKVTTYALHPGVIASDIWRRLPWPVRPIALAFMQTPKEGARTTLYCATSDDVVASSGEYFDDCKVRSASRYATPELARELWSKSEQWCS